VTAEFPDVMEGYPDQKAALNTVNVSESSQIFNAGECKSLLGGDFI
jgi:hypothetical protein